MRACSQLPANGPPTYSTPRPVDYALVTAMGGTSKSAVDAAIAQLETAIGGASAEVAATIRAVVDKAKARTDYPTDEAQQVRRSRDTHALSLPTLSATCSLPRAATRHARAAPISHRTPTSAHDIARHTRIARRTARRQTGDTDMDLRNTHTHRHARL